MMKSITALCVLALSFTTMMGQSNWEVLSKGTGNTKAFDFINKDTGWIAGDRGIVRTTDGGENWLPVFDGKMSFVKLDFINDSIGWAIEKPLDHHNKPYTIIKTIDGGLSWSLQYTAQARDHNYLKGISVISEDLVYIYGDIVLRTVDGGENWTDISPPDGSEFGTASFLNTDTGIVISTVDTRPNICFINRTFDGGDTWDSKTAIEFSSIYNIQFLNDTTSMFLAERWEEKEGGRWKYFLCKSRDLFSSWSVEYDRYTMIRSCHFYNRDVAISLFVEEDYGPLPMNIMKSTDGGLSWNSTGNMPFNGDIFSYSTCAKEQVTYIFGSSWGGNASHLIKSIDHGNSWRLIRTVFPLNDVHFMNRDKGFIPGGVSGFHHWWGFLLSTADGGDNWDFVFRPEYNLEDFHIVNEANAFITSTGNHGWPREVYATRDGGVSWAIDTAIGWSVEALYFLNDSIGWRPNEYDPVGILRTNDGGQSWELSHQFNYPQMEEIGFIHSLFFIDENRGYGVSEKGKIIKFSGEDQWEVIASEYSLPLNKVWFLDHQFGWITGGYSNEEGFAHVFLRSEEGGESWTEIPALDYIVNDFYFEDRNHGWAAGYDELENGLILETFNGGLDWEIAIDALPGKLNALHFSNGIGWAVGENGLILKTKYSFPSSANRFMVVGDAHHYSPSADFSHSMLHELTLAAIEEEVDFIFFTGDLGMQTFDTPEEEDSVLKDWRFVLDTLYHHKIRVYACRGNVDVSGRDAWDSLFSGIYAFPQNGPDMEKNLSYAIEYENLLFLSLDQYTDAHKINQDWLDSILTSDPKEHIIAAGHEPAFKLLNSNCMDRFPEERNLFWESLSEVGALAYFSGHDHFYDHSLIDDGDSNPDNDIHQVIAGTGGGSIFSDSEYNGDNGRWMPERLFHEEEQGYVLVEINGPEVEMTWKHRLEPNVFDYGGDAFTFTGESTSLIEYKKGSGNLINYPNPFQSGTVINYQLFAPGYVELNIYDLSGQMVATLINEKQTAGKHEVEWNADGMKPGIYLGVMRTQKTKQVIKMVLLE